MISLRHPIDIKYRIMTRMGVDHDWYVMLNTVPKSKVEELVAHYKSSWRHVKAERIS